MSFLFQSYYHLKGALRCVQALMNRSLRLEFIREFLLAIVDYYMQQRLLREIIIVTLR